MKTKTRTAWQLTEQEIEELRIPYKIKKGIYKSINGLNTVEFKTDKPSGTAGLGYTFKFLVNGKKHDAPFNYAQRFIFELPDDFTYFITFGLIQEYAKENNLL